MLIDPLITQLGTLGLRGMARALERLQGLADTQGLPFETGWDCWSSMRWPSANRAGWRSACVGPSWASRPASRIWTHVPRVASTGAG